ncbi:MAG: DUF7507 domain-containing protein [Anaerolineae bacterium]|jgi:uncharacterized repeat protein (TIGR01451 family)
MSPRVRSRLRLFLTLLRIVVVLSLAVSVIPTVLAASDPAVGASEVKIAPSSEEEEPPTPPTEEATPAPSETPAPTEEVTPEPTEDVTPTPPPADEATPTPPADEATPAPTEVAYEPTLAAMLEPAAAGVFPDCGWNCTANDVEGSNLRLSKSQSADIPLDACTPGEPTTAWIWVTLTNTQNASRYRVTVVGDLYVDGVYHSSIEHCALDSIGNKETVDTALTSFQWTCGSRVELRNLLVVWTAGTATVCPHSTDCRDYQPSKCYMQAVAPIAAPLVADFTFDDVCLSDGTVDFVDETTGGEMPYTYAWDFGDGGTSTSQNPSHTYAAAGDYQVTLTVTDAQTPPRTDSQTYTVHVWASPVASFTATPLSGPAPLEVTFTDTSTAGSPNGGAIAAWAWDFDDGGTSTAQNPTHTFSAVGTYTVKLTVTDAHGCSHYVTHDIEATATPGFTVDKKVLAPHDTEAAEPGDTIYYEIDVENTGNVDLEITDVDDTLIASLTGPAGDDDSNGKLSVGETWTYSGSYEVTDADVCDDIDNTATVYAEYGQWSDDESDSVTVTTDYTADIAIVKEADVETIGVGGTIHYTITVTNEGNVALADVLVSDSRFTPSGPTGDTDGDELLDVDETWVYTGSYNVVESDICAPILNTAEVEAKDPCGNTVDDTSSEVSVDVTYALDIEIEKTTTTAIGEPGDEITYTITVTNTGDVALAGIIVEDDLTGLYWEVPTLPANGGNASKDTTYTVTEGDLCGDIVNTATATVDDPCGGEGITVSDTVTVETLFSPELTVTKSTEFEGPAKVGDTIEYTIEVANTGDVTVTDLEVTDTLLSSVTYVSGDDNEDEVLDVDETWVYTGSYEVTEADICGDIVNTASATGMAACESPVSDDSNEVTVATTSTPEITVTKSTEFEGPATVGDTIEYMIEVENTGDVSVYDLAVIDAMLADLAYVSGDDNANSVLDVDEVWVYDGSYEVAEQDVCWSGLVNSAEASGLSPCEDVVTDTSNEVTVGMTYHAELTVDKTTTLVGKAKSGDTVQYAIKVTNTGNVTLYDVTVTDLMLGIVADTSIGDLAPDASETIYGSYKVQSGDKGKSLTNTAVATALDPCEQEVRAEDSVTIQVSKPSVKKPTPVPPTPTPVPTPPLPPVLPPTGVAGTGALAWPLLAGLGATALLAIRLRRRR